MAVRPHSTSPEIIVDNIKKVKDDIIQVYEMLPNFCLKEEIPDLLSNLQDVMKSYVMQETKYQDLKKSKQTVLQDYMQKVANDPDTNFTLDEINELLKTTLSKETEKHPEGYWENDQLYSSMKTFTEEEDANLGDQEMNDEDDLAVTGVTVQTIDPYSKREFSDPVKNTHCKHSYEKEIIFDLISKNSKVKCYWMGCNNRTPIKPQDLVPDDELKRHMTRLKARAAI